MADACYCTKCKKTMSDLNFYTLKDGSKPDLCKACMTMHVNNWDPDTYLWILQTLDLPYIESEWISIRDKEYAKDPKKMNGMSVLGRYISKMKLKQWKQYCWADTEELKQIEEAKRAQAINKTRETHENIKEMYERGEISEAQYKTYMDTQAPEPVPAVAFPEPRQKEMTTITDDKPFEEVELIDVAADLTKEDKVYLATKWGTMYHANEWVALEKLYEEFMNSFRIEGAARLDTLKMICKTSLKMNQAIDCGDIESYQKLSKVYDAMMKSAKFTEAQNKDEKNSEFDSIGQIVLLAESVKGGGKIPRYDISIPRDVIDETIVKLKDYYTELVKNETSLGNQIEQFMRKMEVNADLKRDKLVAKQNGETFTLADEDHIDFNNQERADKDLDARLERSQAELEEVEE